jgi:outer membrane lipoprotein-sorting protein
VKAGLAARDAKLSSYHLEGDTDGHRFEFFYRSPNRMRGILVGPQGRTFSFDGSDLFELVPAESKLLVYEDKLPPAKSAELLTRVFSPFAPEGFRAPLLGLEGVTAEWDTDAGTPTVHIHQTLSGEGLPLSVDVTLRWPSLDFLSKTLVLTSSVQARMERESCDTTLALCVPTRIRTLRAGEPESVTTFTRVELNPPLAVEDFSLRAPPGHAVEHRSLVESSRP